MIIFLYGPDTYRSRQKLKEIISSYKKAQKGGLSLKYIDGSKLEYQDFKNEFQTGSLFSQKKLVILEDSFSNKEFKEAFLKEGKKFVDSEDILLFYETGEISRSSLLNFLKNNAKTQEFKILGGKKLKSWIEKEFERHEAKANYLAIERLIDFVGNDLWQLSNEIKKLVSYKEGKEIEVQDIDLLVRSKIETDIFKTIDALASGNRKQALLLFHKHLQNGDSPFYLFTMIAFQFRNLLIVKHLVEKGYDFNSVLEKSKLHPYVARKAYWYAKNFEIRELKRIYQRLFEIDLKIKKGQIPPKVALDLLVFEI